MVGTSRPVSRILSRAIIHLRLTLPPAWCSLPGRIERATRALHGLAPGGVYLAAPVA